MTRQVDRECRQRRNGMPIIGKNGEKASLANTDPKWIVLPASSSSRCQTRMEPLGQPFPPRHVLPSLFFSLPWLISGVGLVNQGLLLFVVWHDRCPSQRTGPPKARETHCTSNLSLSVLHQLWGPESIVDEDEPAARPDKAAGLLSHRNGVCLLSMRRIVQTNQEPSSSSLHGRES